MNIFKQLGVSIYSPKAIASFRMQGIGKSILYVFLLSLLAAIPIIVNFSIAITQSVQSVTTTIDREFPPFAIENGQLKSEANEPIITEKDGMTIYFDSSGTLTGSDLDSSEDSVAFLKNEFIIASAGTTQEFSYSMINMEITKEKLLELLETIDSALPLISIIPILLIFLFASLMKFIEVSILGLMGSLVSTISGKPLPYRPLWNMGAYSATLSTIFFMIMDLLQTAVPGGFMLNWFVSFIILYLALKEINPEKTQVA